jgi:N-acetyl-alpha-D-glucosaminyl L-malate synthase BshA
MSDSRELRIGITCYPSVGGSGILATALGTSLAQLGHEVHFISYDRPVRLPTNEPRLHFHAVDVNDYALFKYPDYTLPLSVTMAEVSERNALDILHVHYAVPHATAAILARDMLPPDKRPKVITTLHGTDTTLLGRDPGYGPAIRHALDCSDTITTVSDFLRRETERLLQPRKPIEVIHNFFDPRPCVRSRETVREELGIGNRVMLIHSSNLRQLKRIDLLLEAAARIKPQDSFRLVILAGASFEPHVERVRRLGLEDRVIVRENVSDLEDYLAAADIGFFTSDTESFCLSILEAMALGCPSVARAVGGIPEVVESGVNGMLVDTAEPGPLADALTSLIADPDRRRRLGDVAKEHAKSAFSSETIVPLYIDSYRRTLGLA